MTQNWLGKLKNRDRGIQFIQHLENIVTVNIFDPCMVYNSHVYSNSNRNLLSMTGKFEEQIEEFSLFNTCRTLSPPIFLILVWFTITTHLGTHLRLSVLNYPLTVTIYKL